MYVLYVHGREKTQASSIAFVHISIHSMYVHTYSTALYLSVCMYIVHTVRMYVLRMYSTFITGWKLQRKSIQRSFGHKCIVPKRNEVKQ